LTVGRPILWPSLLGMRFSTVTMAKRKHRRHDEILRQWRVLLALSNKEWFNLREIYDCLPPRPRRHKRTILRDLEVLSKVFPIERRRGDRAEYQWRLRHVLTIPATIPRRASSRGHRPRRI
jgi:hypothetical protein